MARTFYAQNLALLRDIAAGASWAEPQEDGGTVDRWFVGTVFALDPCGRFHHPFSPNGSTDRCDRWWGALGEAAARLGGDIAFGDDPCDVFFERLLEIDA